MYQILYDFFRYTFSIPKEIFQALSFTSVEVLVLIVSLIIGGALSLEKDDNIERYLFWAVYTFMAYSMFMYWFSVV